MQWINHLTLKTKKSGKQCTFQKVWKILLSIIPLYDNATVRKSGRKPDGLNFRFLFFSDPCIKEVLQ